MSGGLRHEGDEDRFVIIPRPTIRDGRLSFRSRGLLAFILDLPPGFDVSAPFLIKQGSEGREAIYASLRELRAAGYYRVEKRPASGGRWVTGTAVSKVARPSWAAEFAAQEAARLARREEPIPTYEPAEITDGDVVDTPTDLRLPDSRLADGRSPDGREAVGHKEELPRRTVKEENSDLVSHVGRAPSASPPPAPGGDASARSPRVRARPSSLPAPPASPSLPSRNAAWSRLREDLARRAPHADPRGPRPPADVPTG